jgi:hypothetical protein
MKDSSEMQFYLNKVIDTKELIDFFSNVLAMKVMTLDNFDDDAPAFMQITEYETGNFPIGINLAWNKFLKPLIFSHIEVASQLAQRYQVAVVTDLPEEHSLVDDPFCWCLAEPDGSVSEISEDIIAEESEGLLLNEDTKKKLEMLPRLYQQVA